MSSNLNAPVLVGGQANPETTVNDAVGVLDAAVTETLVVDCTSNATLTSAQYRSAIRFSCTPVGASGKSLTLPAVKRLVYISNDDSADALTVTKGSTTVVLAFGTGGFFYTDGTTNGLVQLSTSGSGGGAATTLPADLNLYISGKPGAGATVLRFKVPRAFTLPASLTGSNVTAGVAATASSVFTIKNNGSSIGTVTFAISGTVATFSFASPVTFAVGDVIEIFAPGSQDATLADIGFNLLGSRDLAVTGLGAADLNTFIVGKPGAGVTVFRMKVVREFIWDSGLTGSYFTAGTASAASKVFDVLLNGGSIGSITFATSATGAATFATAKHFVVGDIITITAPAAQDTTLADIAFNILGSR